MPPPPPPRDHHYEMEEPQDYVERKPFRWGRFLVLSFLLLVVVVLLGHWWWSRRGEKALAAQMAEYAKRGEPATLADFNEEEIPDAMNAAIDLRSAATAMKMTTDDQRAFDMLERHLPMRDKEIALIGKLVGDNGKVFEHVATARTKPAVHWKIKFQSPVISTLLIDLNPQKQISNLLAAAALLAHHHGDDATAIARVEDMFFISRAIAKQPFTVSHLVSMGISMLASDVLRQIAPDLRVTGGTAIDPSGKPAERRRIEALIADLLDEAPTRAGFRRAMHAERVAQLDGTQLFAKGDTRFIGGVMGGGGPQPAFGIMGGVLRPVIYQDGLMMVRYTTTVADASREETYPAAKAKAPDVPYEQLRSVLHVNARLFMPSLGSAMERHYRTIVDRRATAVVLAIRLYAADHDGQLPQRLDDLVPKYLPHVPVDAFSPAASPLRYVRGPGEPMIYSVNTDGADNGGSNLDRRGKPAESNWNALDAIYHLKRQPRPAEPELEPFESEMFEADDVFEPGTVAEPLPAESIEPAPK